MFCQECTTTPNSIPKCLTYCLSYKTVHLFSHSQVIHSSPDSACSSSRAPVSCLKISVCLYIVPNSFLYALKSYLCLLEFPSQYIVSQVFLDVVFVLGFGFGSGLVRITDLPVITLSSCVLF